VGERGRRARPVPSINDERTRGSVPPSAPRRRPAREWRDQGGPGYPGRRYGIGVPEVFVPNTPGQFVPLGGAGVVQDDRPIQLEVNLDGRTVARVLQKPQERERRRGFR
jgi:hypothetical protein